MSEIKKATLEECGQLLTDALLTYEKAINEGFLKCDKDFAISLGLKIKPAAGDGDFDLEASISFIKDKVKDTFSRRAGSAQGNLFEDHGSGKQLTCPMRPEKVYASFCNSGKCESRCITHNSEPNAKGEILEQAWSCGAWADEDHYTWLAAFYQDCQFHHEDQFPYILDPDMPWVTAAEIGPEMFRPRACRVCGCTEDHACPGGCSWVDGMQNLCTTCAKNLDTYRVRNKQTGAWWEGPAESPEKAAELAGQGVTQYDDFEVRVRTAKGGWGKPKPSENACGKEVRNGICSHLWTGDGGSMCADPQGKDRTCCRECDKDCNSRCANAGRPEKNGKRRAA